MDPVTHKPRRLKAQCATCIGRPGNVAGLRPGRLKQLVRDNTGDGKMGLPCHETISYPGQEAPIRPAICCWFYENYGHLANGIRIMERLGGFTEVDPPPDPRRPGADVHT
jgi:hypothetical protein